MHINMVTKTITVTEEAYQTIKSMKKENESFSQLFIRIKKKELVILAELFSILKLVEFDKESAFRSAVIEKELTKEGKMINLIDIFIASICKTNNFIMLTSDKDFKKIKGLKINLIS